MATNNQGNKQQGSGTSNRGFASMDPQRQREIASQGGKAAHEKGTAHEFTSEEARRAGSMSHGNRQSANASVSAGGKEGSRQRGSKQSEINQGSQQSEMNRGSQQSEMNRGSQQSESNRGSQQSEMNRGSQQSEMNQGSQQSDSQRNQHPERSKVNKEGRDDKRSGSKSGGNR